MQIKHFAKALAWSLTAAFVFTACQSEDFSTQGQSSPKRTSKHTPSATIQLSISSDINLPKGLLSSIQRSTSFMLENGDKGHLRPRIDFTLSSYKTKLYLRKKGSHDPKEIFSVTIEDGDWQVRDVLGNKIHLSAGMNAHPRLDKAIPELDVYEDTDGEVYENSSGVGFHPYAPASHYPKAIPQLGEEWEAAAIICSGDLKEDPYNPGQVDTDTPFPSAVCTPVRMLHSIITAATGAGYIHSDFKPTDPSLPFRQDGVWLIYPRGISYRYKSLEDYNGLKPLINDLPRLYKELLQAFAARYEAYKADYAANKSEYEGTPTTRAELHDRADKYIKLAANYNPDEEKKSNYGALSRQYKALYQDAQWLYRRGSPEQQAFVHRYEAPGTLLGPWATMQDVVAEMDIPFCADWTPISIYEEDGKTVLQIHGLKAKSPGSILHYELNFPSSTMATPSMLPSPTAGGRALAYGARRSTFRGVALGGNDYGFIAPLDLLDNLETNAGTHYGALWYDQTGNGVHWEHGQWMGGYAESYAPEEDVDADYGNLPEDYFAYHIPNKERMPIFHRTFGVKESELKKLKENSTYHVLYFLMPHYDSDIKSGAIPSPETKFWLKWKKENGSKNYGNKYPEEYHFFIPYDLYNDSDDDYEYYWTVQKDGQAEGDDYVSATQPKPNQIHWVRLTCRKNKKPK
ncbi:hypothetical protein [Porphyromonas sp.]